MSPEARAALTQHQRDVAARVLQQESARRKHVLVSLSGAHAYGFPSPDSDLDLKAVHLDPTEQMLGFPRSVRSAERLEIVDGVEIDYSSNELGHVLQGVLRGNGNYIERFLSGYLLAYDETFFDLQALVRGALSKRVHRHYAGFATQVRSEWEKTGRTSAKKLLYVLRTLLTGAHLLRTGVVITDVTALLRPYLLDDALELVAQKRRGERSELPPEMSQRWAERLPALFSLLDAELERSALPEAPRNAAELEEWLVQRRLAVLTPKR